MNILLSAFSCDPSRGSEPSVGWGWVKILSQKGHQVTVLYSGNHSEKSINSYLKKSYIDRVSFVPVFLPNFLYRNRRFIPQLYYYFWQIKVLFVAIKLKKEFDIIHHVTYVNVKYPSFLWLLRGRFIFGPVSGGDCVPAKLRVNGSSLQRLKYFVRDFTMKFPKYDPLCWLCLRYADEIHVTTQSTKKIISKNYHGKIKQTFGIAFEKEKKSEGKRLGDSVNIMYAGLFQHLKGIHISIKAFDKFPDYQNNISFSIYGEGPEKRKLIDLASENKKIVFNSWVPRDKMAEIYCSHDIMLFTSLQDSGGMVLLEAMSHGLVPVVLALGGPGVICDNSCAEVVDVEDKFECEVIDEVFFRLKALIDNPDEYFRKSAAAIERSKQFSWDQKYNDVYSR